MMRQIEIGLGPFKVALRTEYGDGQPASEGCSGTGKPNEGPRARPLFLNPNEI
jgi:hypothetical protein